MKIPSELVKRYIRFKSSLVNNPMRNYSNMRYLTKIFIKTSFIFNTNFCSGCWTCNVEDIPQSSLLAHRNNLPCSELDQYAPIACDNIPRCKQAEHDICWVDRGMSTDFNAECQLGYECVILDPDIPSLLEIVKNTIV